VINLLIHGVETSADSPAHALGSLSLQPQDAVKTGFLERFRGLLLSSGLYEQVGILYLLLSLNEFLLFLGDEAGEGLLKQLGLLEIGWEIH
jgi:hypothetical protein